jgi:para-aminobenzoate synthetase/4-amino-4-deoxychorismate lyase
VTAPFSARIDFPSTGPLAFDRPSSVLVAEAPADLPALLDAVERGARAGRWAVGWVGYEAAAGLDPALRTRPPGQGPLAVFGLFDGAAPAAPVEPVGATGRLGPLSPAIDAAAHARAVGVIREALAAGVAYQVNLTFPLRGRFEGDPFALYRSLRRGQGACHGACIVAAGRAVVSASPELFFERKGAVVRARPMKGTGRRGRFEEEDAAAAAALQASAKERAENVMIVDLLRNDLGRVAVPGSVGVPELFRVERYRTVLQLVSTVEARLAPGTALSALFTALFPCGSVTGAPKVSAMGVIADVEPGPRGAYCGAIGLVRPGGDAEFSVAIRTVEIDLATGEARCGVGGGITGGSDAAGEWEEALAKGAFLAADEGEIGLIETLRLEDGAYPLLERHLARLAASASHLGLPADLAAAREALERRAREAGGRGARVRLLLRDGAVETELARLPAPAAEPLPVRLAKRPISRWDPRLFHKTTQRAPYAERRAEAPEPFDVLLWNEERELTEFTIGNLVVELDGEQWTPPRGCGLLGGVMRAELLARGEIRERAIRVDELARASRLWLVNAVRGRVPVRLVPPGP